MTTWIIAYSKDGNTSILRTESDHQPDIDEAVALVTQKAEQDYAGQEDAYGHDPDEGGDPCHSPGRTLTVHRQATYFSSCSGLHTGRGRRHPSGTPHLVCCPCTQRERLSSAAYTQASAFLGEADRS